MPCLKKYESFDIVSTLLFFFQASGFRICIYFSISLAVVVVFKYVQLMRLDTIGNTGLFMLQVSAFVWKTGGYGSSGSIFILCILQFI